MIDAHDIARIVPPGRGGEQRPDRACAPNFVSAGMTKFVGL